MHPPQTKQRNDDASEPNRERGHSVLRHPRPGHVGGQAWVLPFGAIGDDFGRKRVLIAGTIVFGVAAAIAGTADSVELVIAMRAGMGVGAAMAMPATLSTITTILGADQRKRGVALWSGFAAAGAVIGLVLSGALLEEFSWRSTFYGTAIFAAVTLVAVIILVPDTKSDGTPSPGSARELARRDVARTRGRRPACRESQAGTPGVDRARTGTLDPRTPGPGHCYPHR
ncbi:MFS transporter [Tsukamurella hominis]|uniref:MFS transporter n=1 Tax=Tsukamurella hominis TaxID=1970232 RepID=UPI0039EB721F